MGFEPQDMEKKSHARYWIFIDFSDSGVGADIFLDVSLKAASIDSWGLKNSWTYSTN